MKTKEGARKRILKALMEGRHISVFDANIIGNIYDNPELV